MEVDRRVEELCERVTLVDGVGSLRRSEFCVMSFVALLGGERHTDHPVSASPLIRNLAIPINDAMPPKARQRLKPFALRIVGTRDGCDHARAEVLRQALATEILPRMRRERRIALLLAQLERGTPPGYEPSFGSAVGELLARCMRDAATPEQRSWYWDEAIILLDRLCDIGPPFSKQALRDEQITRAEQRLGSSWLGSLPRRRLPVSGRASRAF